MFCVNYDYWDTYSNEIYHYVSMNAEKSAD